MIVFCRARLGSKAPAWARLGRARAHNNLEPGPGRRLGLGSAGLRLKPGLQTKKCSDASLDNRINQNILTIILEALGILTIPHTATSCALHMRPMSKSSLMCNLSTACAGCCDSPTLVSVAMFTSGCSNLAWCALHAPREYELHHAGLAHGICEALWPSTCPQLFWTTR